MDLEKAVYNYLNGDEKAFEYIYSKTLKLVRVAIYSYVTDSETIEDIVQEVYFKVHQSLKSYAQRNFTAYIYTIAKNKALDYVRKKKETPLDETYLVDSKTNPYLAYALNHLEIDEKEVFLMKVLYGHTTKKVASILNLEPSKVNQLYYLAKNKLRKSLEDKDEI